MCLSDTLRAELLTSLRIVAECIRYMDDKMSSLYQLRVLTSSSQLPSGCGSEALQEGQRKIQSNPRWS